MCDSGGKEEWRRGEEREMVRGERKIVRGKMEAIKVRERSWHDYVKK